MPRRIAGRMAAFAREASGTGPWKMSKIHAARAARTGQNEAYGTRRRSQGRQDGAAADAGSQRRHAACLPVRSTGSKRRRLMRSRKSSQRGFALQATNRACLAVAVLAHRRLAGTTSAFARRPISASIARPQGGAWLAGLMVPASGTFGRWGIPGR